MSAQSTPGELSHELIAALHGIKSVVMLPKGTQLFEQGAVAEGVYLVERGEVRVWLMAPHKQRQLLDVVHPGHLLGLSEAMIGGAHRVTADADAPARLAFIPRGKFVELLGTHGDFCMEIVRLLSEDLHGLYQKFRSITAHPGRPRHRALDEQMN